MKSITTQTKLLIGQKVYFEDEYYQGNGTIHYIPTDQQQEFNKEVHGENCLSILPLNHNRARFIPLSQIVLL